MQQVWTHLEKMFDVCSHVGDVLDLDTGFDSCDSTTVKCSSCGGTHVTGHCTCLDERKEQEILVIQKKQKVGRARALQIFETGGDNRTHNDVGNHTSNI